jgi:hypothetical protein
MSVDDRNPISRKAMQSAITVAVEKADPDWESFVGVIVQWTNPKSCRETNSASNLAEPIEAGLTGPSTLSLSECNASSRFLVTVK